MEKSFIRRIMRDDNIAKISVIGIEDVPGKAFEIFSILSKRNISIDIILQVTGCDNKKDITFTASADKLEEILDIIQQQFNQIYKMERTKDVSKISIIGSGMVNQPGIAASIFEIMDGLNIDIQMVSTSEMSISMIIDKCETTRAVHVLRDKLNV